MKTLNQFLDESMGGGVPLTPQELEIQKKMSRLNVRLARKRSQQMQKAKVDDTETAPEQVKEASAVLDANKKLEKEKKTKKDKAELAKLTHIYKGMKKGIYNSYEPEGESIGERTLASYIPSDRQGEVHRANLDYTKAQLKKKEDQSTKNRGDLSKRDAGKMAKERLRTKKIMSMGEAEDKAFNFVLNKLKSKYGSGVMTKGDKMPEPSAAQKKKNAEIRAKRAKEDHRDPTEKASDGRYSDRYSNRGSD